MKKLLTLLLSGLILLSLLAACTPDPSSSSSSSSGTSSSVSSSSEVEEDPEIVDGRFVETRKITVEIYDRSNDGGSPPDNNVFTDFIKEGMLRDHNVEVEYVTVPRFPEEETLNNLLAANDAPDICVTYSYATILTYAKMGGVLDLAPIIEENKHLIPDVIELITEDNLYYDLDPNTGELWAIEARLYNHTGQKTFIREDWLNKLDLPEPTTLEEFEDTLRAFQDNAQLLLGADAKNMIPYLITSDVGWYAIDLADSVLPGDMTDKLRYTNGYDDRRLLYPNYKEAIRILNKWYNEGLIWKDFALYPTSDTTAHANLLKAGYVGAYTQSSDDPYRNGDEGIQNTMRRVVSEDAAYITVPVFKNDKGVYQKYWSAPIDRKVFFPATNTEPVASLMYLNWICKAENLEYIQTGEPGINHQVMDDGSLKIEPVTGEYIINSQYNIDYTILCNGLHLATPEKTVKTLAQGYAGIDPKYIQRAYDHSKYNINYLGNPQAGNIAAEEGMATTLKEKRDNMLNQAVVASVDNFDQVYDSGLADYLASGGQAIIDERTTAWEKMHGDKEWLD